MHCLCMTNGIRECCMNDTHERAMTLCSMNDEGQTHEYSMNETPTKAAREASMNGCSMNETPTKAAWRSSHTAHACALCLLTRTHDLILFKIRSQSSVNDDPTV